MSLIVEIQVVVEDVHLLTDSTEINTWEGNAEGSYQYYWSIPGHPRIVPGEVLTITVARTGKIR